MTERNSGKKPLRPQAFSYRKPEPRAGDTRELVKLCQTPGMRGAVHVVRQGGGENLHSHPNVDGFWMVVSGQVAFYGEGDISFGEFGPMEGMLIPSGNRYRFESVGDGDAELLQVL